MKHIFILTASICFTIAAYCQTISPSQSNEYCPNVEYTFTATITKPYSSMIGVGSCYVTQLPIPPVGTTFTFKGKFGDANQKQTFKINYTDGTFFDFDYKKIKSLFYGTTCTPIQPSVSQITAARCQVVNTAISFNNVQWSTSFESPILCFGAVANYEYQLPVNWKIGTFTSTGSNWYAGGNSATVTSDLSTGDGGFITIRPANTACGTGLTNGQSQAVSIPISRPAPTLSITPSGNQAFICSGPKNFTLNGLPAGAVITSWTSSDPSLATVPGGSTNAIVAVTKTGGDGAIILTANVTDCNYTYSVPVTINLGTNVPAYYNVQSNYSVTFNNQFQYYTNPPQAIGQSYLPLNKNVQFTTFINNAFLTSPSWTISGTYDLFYPSSNNFVLYMRTPSTGGYYSRNSASVRLLASSGCGVVDKTYVLQAIVNSFSFSIVASPNPVNGSIKLSVTKVADTNNASNKQGELSVVNTSLLSKTIFYLYDMNTNALVKKWNYQEADVLTYNLDVLGIKPGWYILKMDRCDKTSTTKILIQ